MFILQTKLKVAPAKIPCNFVNIFRHFVELVRYLAFSTTAQAVGTKYDT